jgi:P2-related tail formation protein
MTVNRHLVKDATPAEIVLAKAMTDALAVPIVNLLNSDTTTEAFLPFVALGESVDLWYSDWSVARKRLMAKLAPFLATLVGTPVAEQAFLDFVDGVILDKITYPSRFVMGRAVIGRTPVGHPPHLARMLVKVRTRHPARSFIVGRSAIGRGVIRTLSREPLDRCRAALTAAKAPETEYRVSFAHKRQITIDDNILIDDGHYLDEYVDRVKL